MIYFFIFFFFFFFPPFFFLFIFFILFFFWGGGGGVTYILQSCYARLIGGLREYTDGLLISSPEDKSIMTILLFTIF